MEEGLSTPRSIRESPVASPVTGSSRSDGGVNVVYNGTEDYEATHTNGTKYNSTSQKPSSFNFAEEIRRLEVEGNKLRAATITSLANIDPLNTLNLEKNESNIEVGKLPFSGLSGVSSLLDISADQKTISELRIQLENQRKETERLQKQLLGDVSNFRSSQTSTNLGIYGGIGSNNSNNHTLSTFSSNVLPFTGVSPAKSAFSTIPSGEFGNTFMRKPVEYHPPSHLERSLKESQEQVMDLRKRLQEANVSAEEQKKHFRTTVEEMKTKLHETMLNRDTVLDMKQKEAKSQDLLINKLQSSLNHLQDQYKAQEEALTAVSKKMDSHNQSNYVNDAALSQIRNILVERENQRGRHFFETDPATSQSSSMFAHTFERCFQEMDHELNLKILKVSELENDNEKLRKEATERERLLKSDFEEKVKIESEDALRKVNRLSVEHERNMSLANDQATNARQQLSALQTQMYQKESEYKIELQDKNSCIRDLEDKVELQNAELLQERTRWQEKLIEAKHEQVSSERLRVALESSLDAVQKELVETKTEKNELIQTQAALDVRVTDLQSLVSRLEGDLETERDRVQHQRQREEELRAKVMTLENQVSNKQGDIDRLEKMLDVVKQECSAQLVDKVASVESMERDRYLDQIKSLSAQLATMTEKCNRVTVEHQMSRSEMDSLRRQVHDLTCKLEKARSQMELALSAKQDLTSVLGEKHGDLERLVKDKEHFASIAEERSDEVRELKITVDRLTTQLEEKEKILSTFRQQSNNINQLMEVNSKSTDNFREERDQFASALSEKTSMYEEVRSSQESLSRKLKSREKRVRDLEDERVKLNEELAMKSQELNLLQQEKDSVMDELKQSRREALGLTAGKDTLKKELQRVRMLRTKEINKLQTKLKESEQEYRLSQKALRSKDIIDHKAVKFADRAQKEITVKRSEVDILHSKLRRLEEKLESLTREKTMVEKDKDSLKKSLAKSLLHTQELNDELQTTQAQNQELVRRVAELEEMIDKAALRSSASNVQMAKQEQEMATLKIKHQLDLKEAESQSLRSSSGQGSYLTGTGSCMPPFSSASMIPEKDTNNRIGFGKTGGDNELESVRNTLEIRDDRHREFSEVGHELKTLLCEMRTLISGHKERNEQANILPDGNLRIWNSKADKRKSPRDKLGPNFLSAPLRIQDLRPSAMYDKESHSESEMEESWASKSLSGLGELSDFSSYKEWRPCSHSLSRAHRSFSSDLDLSRNSTFFSKGNDADSSRLTRSLGTGSSQKHYGPTGSSSGTALVPDTKELCRRLEEKIDSLTHMGGNLQKENREMADLISLQGEKLDSVKQMERKARGLR